VLCVVDRRKYSEPTLSSAELMTIYAEEHAADCVSKVAEMAGERVPVVGVTRHGLPETVIREYAAEVGADRIVIGAHGDHAKHFSGVGRRLSADADTNIVVATAED
jgi:nucleotide-binding universal stress UspA family protein